MIGMQPGVAHFRKDFGGGNYSDRLILPKDGVAFKVTLFHGETGAYFPDLQDPWDETVYVVKGRIEVHTFFEGKEEFGAGSVYVIPAGNVRSIRVIETCELLCHFIRTSD